MPRTSMRIADELHSALHNAGVAGPYILVGHAFGGYNARAFVYRYLPEIAGLVLIDTDVGDVEPTEFKDHMHHVFLRQAAELRECRDAVAESKPLPPLPGPSGSPPRTCDQQFFRGLPEATWSAELNAKLSEIARSKVAMYDAFISEIEEMPRDEVYLQQHRRSLGSRPIRVLTASHHLTDRDTASTPKAEHLQHLKFDRDITESQARLLGLSSNAKQVFVDQSRNAYLQLDQPEIVTKAIREVYDQRQ